MTLTPDPVRSSVAPLREVKVPTRPLARLAPLIGRRRYTELRETANTISELFKNRTVWNVSSTAAGGGVAEMLHVIVGYSLDAPIDIRWLVIGGDAQFFTITKRIHNRLHGVPGDDGPLGPEEAAHYDGVLLASSSGVLRRVRPGDVVLLHDPQTAGLAAALAAAGTYVVWRCHVGSEVGNEWTAQAWAFLLPRLAACAGYVFSLRGYVPEGVDPARVRVIPPSIDPFSPKNQDLSPLGVRCILERIGLVATEASRRHGDGPPGEAPCTFFRRDGSAGSVERRAAILATDSSGLDPTAPLVVQVSRWDRLKDMVGVMEGFATEVAPRSNAHLALVGPSTKEVADDPEGAQVLAECVAAWEGLPPAVRRKIRLVTLPMDDIDENAAMVNAIQRHATVIVQKSLAEGFGLTVSEGMWKAKAVVASAVGGITRQITPSTGVLLDDPHDLAAFGDAVSRLLQHPHEVARMGARARRHVLNGFVGDRHLLRYAKLLGELTV